MNIRLKQLRLENFKCHKALKLDFDGKDASIYGDNATGKTSIYDALTWLLFGKDSAGNANGEVKPLDERGRVRDHQAVTAVEAELTADGKAVTLRREYREVWSPRRGSGKLSFEGNTSDFFVDGTPCKKFLYEGKIRELVSEELFQMLTSVGYFASGMKWQDRRAVLFDMVGRQSDGELMEEEPRFLPLLEGMGERSLEDYKAKLLRDKRGLKERREDIPGRLDECRRVLDSLQGLEEARAREPILMERCRKLELGEGQRAWKLRELAVLEGENQAFRREQELSRSAWKRELEEEKRRLKQDEEARKREQEAIFRVEKALEETEKRRREVEKRAFSGGVCPTCGQALPFGKMQEAMGRFREEKEREVRSLEEKEKALEAERKGRLEGIRSLDSGRRRERIRALEQKLEQAPEIRDLPGFPEKAAALDCREDQRERELEKARKELREVQALLGKEGVKRQMELRAEELRKDGERAAEALTQVENLLYLMEEFVRFKARRAEEKVNGLFRLASFRLFREQIDGGLEQRCDASFHGVPFLGLNNGMKVNVGIDIIRTLSDYYGVKVPLFIDNAESITRLESAPGQVIRLAVDKNFQNLTMQFS